MTGGRPVGCSAKRMKGFVTLSLERAYRTSSNKLGRDFYALLLAEATAYHRAVGYFSSSVFSVAPEANLQYFRRGATIKLVSSDLFFEEDVHALATAVFDRPKVRRALSLADLAPSQFGTAIPWSRFLAWLVASDLVEVRIACLVGGRPTNLYHEKIGIFYDGHGALVAFSGSANETEPGYVTNFERVDVFASFGPDADRRRARAIEAQFYGLWRNETPGVEVVPLQEALERRLLRLRESGDERDDRPASSEPITAQVTVHPEALSPRSGLTLFRHQREAIAAWAEAGGQGILEMATGAGKTITALSLASRLYDRIGAGFCILIVAPLVHLVDQWIEVASGFGLRPIRCAEGVARWQAELSTAVQALNSGYRPVLSVATTGATLASPSFQRLLESLRKPLLLIADEVHSYGAAATFKALPKAETYRVGLSATPQRWMDEEGTKRLEKYFGSVVYRYTLADALGDEVLTSYRYYPEILEFDEDEMDRYLHLTRQLLTFVGADEDGDTNDIAKRLLIKRARLVASARSKLPRLRALLQERKSDTHILVYCGDGTVEGPDGDETMRQVDAAVAMIGTELRMLCASYTAATPPTRRRELLQAFAAGDIQVLVAIRCLDEGVDVPATRTAFLLASSTNPRQFVQRRGRVLRRFPGKSRADVFDFFVLPSRDDFPRGSTGHRLVRGLVRTQLGRSQEFESLAENGPVARLKLLEIRKHFDLLGEG